MIKTHFTKEIYHKQEIKKARKITLSKVANKIKKLAQGKVAFTYNSKLFRASPVDIVRVISEISSENSFHNAFRNLILNAVVTSEKRSPGSGFIFLDSILGSKDTEESVFYRTERGQLDAIIKFFIGAGPSGKILKEAIKLGGTNFNVTFSNSHDDKFHVRKTVGTQIEGDINEVFSCKPKEINNCSIVYVDGIIESVGEIDHVLQKSSKDNMPLVIIASGFSPEISGILRNNFLQKKLCVIPFVFSGNSKRNMQTMSSMSIECFSRKNRKDIREWNLEKCQKFYDVIFLEEGLLIGSENQNYNSSINIRIDFPNRVYGHTGIFQDRLILGKNICHSAMRNGVVEYYSEIMKNNILVPRGCYDVGIKTAESFLEFIDKIDAFVEKE